MKTPIVDFLFAYAGSGTARLHMPGHKGHAYLGPEALDITEIRGADELYAADGIIAESERNASAIFGTGMTLYSVEGSSHAIRSMILLARQCFDRTGNGCILAARNAHKAFLYALAVCGVDAEWIYPAEEDANSVASCATEPETLDRRLFEMAQADKLPFAVYVTSPDYLGRRADIAGLSGVCRAYGLPLLVDNAHGAYLHFLEEPCHPMDLGAAMCADSAHKTLPALTGAAYLHLAPGVAPLQEAKAAMELTGTTSPSYIVMASLDLVNAQLSGGYAARIRDAARGLEAVKERLARAGVPVLPSEPLKLTVDAAAIGFTGGELGDRLRARGAEPEFCDADYLVCMVTPDNSREDLDKAATALEEAAAQGRGPRVRTPLRLKPLERRMSIRGAVLAPHETVPLRVAEGRICGAPTVSCPPAIPLAVSGEVLDAEALRLMAACGIERVSVIRR
ncbi:MAG: amino acid decarboxylase [Clostridia bacterium]|nr:amino acid decarboxylase [Clostridia bacterium]